MEIPILPSEESVTDAKPQGLEAVAVVVVDLLVVEVVEAVVASQAVMVTGIALIPSMLRIIIC